MSQGETVLILGATGMVSGHALEHALAHPRVEEILTLSRRKLAQELPKLRQWVAADLEKLQEVKGSGCSCHGRGAFLSTRERKVKYPPTAVRVSTSYNEIHAS